MSRRPAIVLLLAALTLTAGCSFLAPNPDSYTATYEYRVGVDATATLEDVTVRVPLPRGGASDPAAFVPNGTVDGFDTGIVETTHGPMLELTADEFAVETRYYRYVEEDGLGRREEIDESTYDPSNPDHQKVSRRTVTVSVTRRATYPIETRTPIGTEPTFYPGATRDLTTCSLPNRGETTCFAYEAPIYLDYDTAADTNVSGHVTLHGSNEWFAGGWTGNSYTDRVGFDVAGPRSEWVIVNGTTEVGRGNYPSPER